MSTPGLQPTIVPSSVSKMNIEAPDLQFFVTTKSPLGLTTRPVGAEVSSAAGAGIVTTKGTIAPVPVYRVEGPVPLSAIQIGLPGPKAMPQAFFRLGSVV